MTEVVQSMHGVPIRLTDERWVHITENHDDLAGRRHDILNAIAEPSRILRSPDGTLMAVQDHASHALVVIYKEVHHSDGFIITAFVTSKARKLLQSRSLLWESQKSKKR